MNRVFNKSCVSMPEIADGTIHACVTSPPYFSLRDYGHAGQIGAEATLDAYVANLVSVFREVRRALRDDGTLWLNIGDSWSGSWGAQGRSGQMSGRSVISARQITASLHNATRTGAMRANGLKPKDQMLVPHTVAMALRADGWYLRDTIIWHKPQCMPSSVRDRTTPAHEYVFLLSKKPRYYYDQEAIRERLAESSVKCLKQNIEGQEGSPAYGKTNGAMKAVAATGKIADLSDLSTRNNDGRKTGDRVGKEAHATGTRTAKNLFDAYKGVDWSIVGANARSVWTIATARYAGDHYAVMPRELARRCILAGCPPGGIVLDPFAGTGTTLEVAVGCGRQFVGYEINPDYYAQIRDRMGMFFGGAA